MTIADDAWVPAGVAYQVIGDELAKRLACSPAKGRDHAADELLFELQEGRVRGRARDCKFDLDDGVELRRLCSLKDPLPTWEEFAPDWKGHFGYSEPRQYSGRADLPREFWEYAENAIWPEDWALGNFTWYDDRYPLEGHARGVEFALEGLPCADAVRAFLGAAGEPAPAAFTVRSGKGGRPAGHGRTMFTTALEAYLQSHPGAPDQPGAISRIASAVLASFEDEPLSEGFARKLVRLRLARWVENPAS